MAAAIGMVGVAIFFIVGIVLNGVAWWREKWWVCPIAMFFWLGLAYYCYTEAGATFDFYKFLTWVCVGFGLVSIGEIFVLKQKAEEEPEETMQERVQKRMEANLSGTFNRKRPSVARRPPRDSDVGEGL